MTDDGGLREDLATQASEMDGVLWCGIPLDTMSTRELIGVIACMKRSEERETKYHQERLDFLLGGARRRK